MRFNNIIIYGIVSLIVLASCEDKKVDTAAVRKELDARKIKKVKPGEIFAFAENKGNQLMDLIVDANDERRDSIIEANNLEYKVIISNQNEQEMNDIESSIFEAYKYSLESESPMPDNTQPIEKGNRIIYTRAKKIDSTTLEMHIITMWRKFIVLEM